jgi:protein TonB
VAEVTLVRGFYLTDRPWRRLGWILPAVFFAWAFLLWSLGFLLERQAIPPAQIPIDATLIELPPPEARRAETPQRPVLPRAVLPEPVKSVEPEPVPAPPPAAESSSPATPSPTVQPQRPMESDRAAARILYRPLPKIPDELRDQAIETEALARFDIRSDGTATVELVRPTPSPALNRIILDTLRTWRFFPAMLGGKPVASTQEVRVRLEVH